jgi:ubiquitin-protein ligase
VIVARGFDNSINISELGDWLKQQDILVDGLTFDGQSMFSRMCNAVGGLCFNVSGVASRTTDLVTQDAFVDLDFRAPDESNLFIQTVNNEFIEQMKTWRNTALRAMAQDSTPIRIKSELRTVRNSRDVRVGLTDSSLKWFVAFPVTSICCKIAMLFSHDYPYRPPHRFFIPPIEHPKVNRYDGRVRFDLLGKDYRATVTVLEIIRGLIELVRNGGVSGARQPR